ncbi:portal protein [bacterium]|nr:portal protein [bacterium]
MSWRKHFTPVDNSGLPLNIQGQQSEGGAGAASNQLASWLPEVYAGSPNRLIRYMQYDNMDADSEINAALDVIAEFGTQEDESSGLPFAINYSETPSDTESKIITKTLEQWCSLNTMYKRAFRIFRNSIKYGDQVFIRDPETYELYWCDQANIEKVVVNETAGKKIEQYFVKNLDPIFEEKVATKVSNLHARPYGSGQGITGIMSPTNPTAGGGYLTGAIDGVDQGTPVDAKHIVHISLTEGMDNAWPFGISILEPIFKTFKQKELLEDSIIIYRVHRAPERRVFFIDVGNMPPHKARQYLEQVKYEVQQKRVPGKSKDGGSVADSAYNPMSMLEDYFFAQTAEGRGSKVDTLPGGENLGQIDDLRYFNNKLLRGLKIPSSYLPTGPEDGSQTFNDGKVGIAYIQEYRFAKYVERLQKQVQEDLDREFKMFLKFRGIEIDSGTFTIEFNPPMNFSSFRDIQLQTERAQLYNQVAAVPYMSNQFKMKKYLGLTEDEILENEELWRQENNSDKYVSNQPEGQPGLGNMGIRPMPTDAVDLEAEPDLTGLDGMGEPGSTDAVGDAIGNLGGGALGGPPEGGI